MEIDKPQAASLNKSSVNTKKKKRNRRKTLGKGEGLQERQLISESIPKSKQCKHASSLRGREIVKADSGKPTALQSTSVTLPVEQSFQDSGASLSAESYKETGSEFTTELARTELARTEVAVQVDNDCDWQTVARRKTKRKNAKPVNPSMQQVKVPDQMKSDKSWGTSAIHPVMKESPVQPPFPSKQTFTEAIDLKNIDRDSVNTAYTEFCALLHKSSRSRGKYLEKNETKYVVNIFAELCRKNRKELIESSRLIQWYLWFHKIDMKPVSRKLVFIFDIKMACIHLNSSNPEHQQAMNEFVKYLPILQKTILKEANALTKIQFFCFVEKYLDKSKRHDDRKVFLESIKYETLQECALELFDGSYYKQIKDKEKRIIHITSALLALAKWIQASAIIFNNHNNSSCDGHDSSYNLCYLADDLLSMIKQRCEGKDKDLFQSATKDHVDYEILVLHASICPFFTKAYGYEQGVRKFIDILKHRDPFVEYFETSDLISAFVKSKLCWIRIHCLISIDLMFENNKKTHCFDKEKTTLTDQTDFIARDSKSKHSYYQEELNFAKKQVALIKRAIKQNIIDDGPCIKVVFSAIDRITARTDSEILMKGMTHIKKLKEDGDDQTVLEIVKWWIMIDDEKELEKTLLKYKFSRYSCLFKLIIILARNTKWADKAQERIPELQILVNEKGKTDKNFAQRYKPKMLKIKGYVKEQLFKNQLTNDEKSNESKNLLVEAFALYSEATRLTRGTKEQWSYWANIEYLTTLMYQNKIPFTNKYKAILPDKDKWKCSSWYDLGSAIYEARKSYSLKPGQEGEDITQHMMVFSIHRKQASDISRHKGKCRAVKAKI